MAKLVPLQEALAKTYALTDRIVYRLYGLAEAEVAIVDGRPEGGAG